MCIRDSYYVLGTYHAGKEPIKIIEQPQSQCKIRGDLVTLSMSVTGPGTLSYQWVKDGEAITSDKYPNCTGVSTPELQVSSFSSKHVGNYKCQVSNEYENKDSSHAELTGIHVIRV